MAKNEDKNFGIPDGATLAQLDSIAKNAKSENAKEPGSSTCDADKTKNK